MSVFSERLHSIQQELAREIQRNINLHIYAVLFDAGLPQSADEEGLGLAAMEDRSVCQSWQTAWKRAACQRRLRQQTD